MFIALSVPGSKSGKNGKFRSAPPQRLRHAPSRVLVATALALQIAVGMKKRWPEMSGYSRAHDPGSNRALP